MVDAEQGPGRNWVKIGPAEDDILPRSRAEKVLQLLMERDPELLAALIGEAATGAAPRRPRARRAPA
jgi:hypothetical protein